MANELIFTFHILSIILAVAFFCRLGKEALITLIAVQAILANLFITKEITLFNLSVTGTDAFTIASALSLNMLQEYFGKSYAKRAIWISFAGLIFYLLMSQFQCWYLPTTADSMHQHFECILSFMPQIVIASAFSYLVSQFVDYLVYAYLKKSLHQKMVHFKKLWLSFHFTIG